MFSAKIFIQTIIIFSIFLLKFFVFSQNVHKIYARPAPSWASQMCLPRSPHAPQGGRSAPRVLSSLQTIPLMKLPNYSSAVREVELLICRKWVQDRLNQRWGRQDPKNSQKLLIFCFRPLFYVIKPYTKNWVPHIKISRNILKKLDFASQNLGFCRY